MVAGPVKYLAASIDSTELSLPSERSLYLDDLAFGETGDSEKITEDGSGNVTSVEYFNGSTETTPNRKARTDLTYSAGLPATEVWKYYDSDGTTVKKTITLTYTWTGSTLTNTVETVS